MKFYNSAFLCLTTALLATSVQAAMPQNQPTSPLLICRGHQCADASFSMSQGFLFNKINQLLDRNIGKNILICEADPFSHICLHEGITFTADTIFPPIKITIKDLTLVNKDLRSGLTGLDLALDYHVQAEKTIPNCQIGLSRLTVNKADKVELSTQDFTCNLTETGRTTLNASYKIDYIDFDYGIIGTHYTVAIGEALQGDRTGYALLRFTGKPASASQKTDVSEDAPSVETEDPSGKEPPVGTGTLPAILRDTAPVNEPSESKTVSETVIRLVPPEQKQQSIVIATPPPQDNTVVKKTTVERVVITPDGKHQVEPPEVRTFINGIETPAP